jgi:hypothetical protein
MLLDSHDQALVTMASSTGYFWNSSKAERDEEAGTHIVCIFEDSGTGAPCGAIAVSFGIT